MVEDVYMWLAVSDSPSDIQRCMGDWETLETQGGLRRIHGGEAMHTGATTELGEGREGTKLGGGLRACQF